MSRCDALDGEGKRCRRTDTRRVQYHGDGEIYGWHTSNLEPVWVCRAVFQASPATDSEAEEGWPMKLRRPAPATRPARSFRA